MSPVFSGVPDAVRDVIYFDCAAAAPVSAGTLERHAGYARRFFANPEAVHGAGVEAAKALERSEEAIGRLLRGCPGRICFTASGTDALRLCAGLFAERSGSVVTSRWEHPAWEAQLKRFQTEVRFVPDRLGRFSAGDVLSVCDEKTRLVLLHHVQGESGLMHDFGSLREALHRRSPKAVLALDCVQSAGKFPLPDADWILFSAHKFGSVPCGGILYDASCPMAGELQDLRHKRYAVGRPEPAAALTAADRLAELSGLAAETLERVRRINGILRAGLTETGRAVLPFESEECSPYILYALLPGYESAVLIRMLWERGIAVSSGSACSAESPLPGRIPLLLGRKKDGFSGLRLSFGPENTPEQAERFLAVFRQVLRSY